MFAPYSRFARVAGMCWVAGCAQTAPLTNTTPPTKRPNETNACVLPGKPTVVRRDKNAVLQYWELEASDVLWGANAP